MTQALAETTGTIDPSQPTGLQKALLQATRSGVFSTIISAGPMRGGKTAGQVISAVDLALWNACHSRGNHQYILGGQSVSSIGRNMKTYFEDVAAAYGLPFKSRGGDTPCYEVGSAKFFLFGGQHTDSYKSLRGLTAHSAFLDELTLLDKTFYETCIDRCSFSDSLLMGVSNPDSPYHWLRAEVMLADTAVHLVVSKDDAETPAQRLRPFMDSGKRTLAIESDFHDNQHYSETRRQEMLQRNPMSWYTQRMIQGAWVAPAGLVFPVESYMVVNDDFQPAGYVGLDAGTSGTTAACLAVPRAGGRTLIADEYVHIGQQQGILTDDQHLDAMQARWKFGTMVIDPAAASMKAAARKRGIVVANGKNSLDIGIFSHINSLLHNGTVAIHAGCKYGLMELASYSWNEVTQKPVKKFDHFCDAARYLILHLHRVHGGYYN